MGLPKSTKLIASGRRNRERRAKKVSGRETEIQFLVPISLLSALLHGTDGRGRARGNISISRSE